MYAWLFYGEVHSVTVRTVVRCQDASFGGGGGGGADLPEFFQLSLRRLRGATMVGAEQNCLKI
jgi:hypothetical protein